MTLDISGCVIIVIAECSEVVPTYHDKIRAK